MPARQNLEKEANNRYLYKNLVIGNTYKVEMYLFDFINQDRRDFIYLMKHDDSQWSIDQTVEGT